MRDKNEGKKNRAGGGGDGGETHLCPQLVVQKVAEGKISYELSWRLRAMIKKQTHGTR